MSRRSSPARRLLGWGILAAVGVVIAGVFLITRALAPGQATTVAQGQPAGPAPQVQVSPAPAPQPAAPSQAAPSAPGPAVVDLETMDQPARRALLTRLIGQGVLTGVDITNPPPRVGATALFFGLSPDIQRQFMAVAYAYVNNGKAGSDPLLLIDVASGRIAGTFTPSGGLSLQ